MYVDPRAEGRNHPRNTLWSTLNSLFLTQRRNALEGDFMITDPLHWKGGGLLAIKVPCGPTRTGKSESLQWMRGLTLTMEVLHGGRTTLTRGKHGQCLCSSGTLLIVYILPSLPIDVQRSPPPGPKAGRPREEGEAISMGEECWPSLQS